MDIFELACAFRGGSLVPSDVIRDCLERIRKYDPKLGAIHTLTANAAQKAAVAADEAFAGQCLVGPLCGIPFSVKDIYDVESLVTGKGQMRTDLPVARKNAKVVHRLLAAGAILLGKTRTNELAMGGWGLNTSLGTPWNTWDMNVHRVPGGSSSGSAVAVSAGFSSFALGTDTGGSVRLPASFCGLTGLNVTANCLPRDGIMPLSKTLDAPGPIARTALDAAILLQVMGGRAAELVSRDLKTGGGLLGTLMRGGGIEGLRIASINSQEREICSAEVLEAYDGACDTLSLLGAQVESVSPVHAYSEIARHMGALIDAEAYETHGDDYCAPAFCASEYVRDRVLSGAKLGADAIIRIHKERAEMQSGFLNAIREYDALITPTTPTTAIPVDQVDDSINPAHFTRPFNFLGMCGVALPIGLDQSGLPTSLQVVARGRDEAMALRVAAAFERARGPIGAPPLQ